MVLDPGKEKCIFEEKSQGEKNADFFRFLAEFLQAWNLGFKYAARGFRVFRKEIRAHLFPNDRFMYAGHLVLKVCSSERGKTWFLEKTR